MCIVAGQQVAQQSVGVRSGLPIGNQQSTLLQRFGEGFTQGPLPSQESSPINQQSAAPVRRSNLNRGGASLLGRG